MTNVTTYTKETMPEYLTKIVNTALTPFLETINENEIENLKLDVDLNNFKITPIIGILTFNSHEYTIRVKILRKTSEKLSDLETTDYSKITEVIAHHRDYLDLANNLIHYTIILDRKNG